MTIRTRFQLSGLIMFGMKKYTYQNIIMKYKELSKENLIIYFRRQLKPFNATILEVSKDPVDSDIELFQNKGVPGISLRNDNERYFWFHHTQADTMTVEDPLALDLGTAVFSAVTFILADISVELPKASKMYYM